MPSKFNFGKQNVSEVHVYSYGCHGFEFFDEKGGSILKIGKLDNKKELVLEKGHFIIGAKARGRIKYDYLTQFEFKIMKLDPKYLEDKI